ncbi:MAG: amidohydrolase family protein [Hyphomicrobiaceae bacterium]
MSTDKIALEEHFMHPDFVDYWSKTASNISPDLFGRAREALEDFGERRIASMDSIGIEKSVLSLAGPGVQAEIETGKAVRMAKVCNDYLFEQIAKNPKRFGGFAHLALQDPTAAADELERCVSDLGFSGALINGQTNGAYLDDDRFSVLWERASDLTAPIYLHPNNPPDVPYMYHNHPELWGPVWSWTVETGNHALRILFAGVFDRFPKAKLILGHMGETLPFQLWRLDCRWEISNRGSKTLSKNPSEYFRNNVWCTTAGVCSDEPLRCTIDAMSADRVMFSVDYPFESSTTAGQWIDQAPLSSIEREKVCHENARALLRLKPHSKRP